MDYYILVGFQGTAHHHQRHGQLPHGGVRVQRGGHKHQVDLAVRGKDHCSTINMLYLFNPGNPKEMRVWVLAGAEDPRCPRQVQPPTFIFICVSSFPLEKKD